VVNGVLGFESVAQVEATLHHLMSSSPCRPFTMPLVLRTAHKPQLEQEHEEEEDASTMEVTYQEYRSLYTLQLFVLGVLPSLLLLRAFFLSCVHLQNQAPRDQFIQDPAVLRERAEAKRAATQPRKGYVLLPLPPLFHNHGVVSLMVTPLCLKSGLHLRHLYLGF